MTLIATSCGRLSFRFARLTRRALATSTSSAGPTSDTPPSTPVYEPAPPPDPFCFQVWGANTDVGKTVFSAALLRACTAPAAYIKPVQTGFPAQDDGAVVTAAAANKSNNLAHFSLFTYSDPVSPHLAARGAAAEPAPPDELLCSRVSSAIHAFLEQLPRAAVGPPTTTAKPPPPSSASSASAPASSPIPAAPPPPPVVLVETAGGVLSPAPSGTPQADAYRPLRLPSVLLADPALGGISTTLAAFEALHARGYDIPAVVFLPPHDAQPLDNEAAVEAALAAHQFHRDNGTGATAVSTAVFQAPPLPPPDRPLAHYFLDPDTPAFFASLLAHLRAVEAERRAALAALPDAARASLWYPFTQHTMLGEIVAIDSAHGDDYVVHRPAPRRVHAQGGDAPADAAAAAAAAAGSVVTMPMFDASGSWWTNGVGHGHPRVMKAIAAAAGRYGHVLLPQAAHAPAADLAERLLRGVGAGWADRVFYSDNGSTAVEVALKMAFRKRAVDRPDRAALPYVIVGARDSYHGDTLGAMQCSEESDFNSRQTPWYVARGLFFEQPTVALRNGVWTVQPPPWLVQEDEHGEGREGGATQGAAPRGGNSRVFASSDMVFARDRVEPNYQAYIARTLDALLATGEVDLGALVLEPVLLGAGGMHIVDPAFQRALVHECRARDVPVVFDEIFAGLWRTGTPSAATGLLGCEPDVAAFGKLLTGGTVPLSVTLASEAVLRAFDGASKRDALLHGHSYTAHPIGCAAAVESLRMYDELFASGPREYWCEDFAKELSSIKCVERVAVLGTVLSVEVKAADDVQGYGATGAVDVLERLAEEGIWGRALGNVLYMLCTPLTEKHVCDEKMQVLAKVLHSIEREAAVPKEARA